MIWMGKFWKAPWKWEPRLGPYDLWMMQRWWKRMETYQIWSNLHIHSAPNPDTYLAMTGHLLPVHGFENIKKRHLAGQGFRYRNDILGLGKQEDWHSRMSFFARRFKHCRPHLQEISGKKTTADGPKTSRSIPTAQNMHNLLRFSEEHPQSKALPWSRVNNENHSRINCRQPHICRLDGSSPLCLNYVQIWTHQISDWIWLGFNGYHR